MVGFVDKELGFLRIDVRGSAVIDSLYMREFEGGVWSALVSMVYAGNKVRFKSNGQWRPDFRLEIFI